jgi:ribonuclease E/ribonuclease G
VVIDFVDLDAKSDRARLGAALHAAFAEDPAEVRIYPMSPLGLVELSRQRTGPSLAERQAGGRPAAEETVDE